LPRCRLGTGRTELDSIENLRTFVAVADTQSLSAAARQLRVAASVVTKRVDQLESRVGARLFTRSTRRVALTELGARYLSSARRLMHDYDEVLAEMRQSSQPIEGHIRIKVPTPIAVAYMADTLAEFQEQFPLVSLDVVLTERALDPSEEGFDIAMGAHEGAFPGVIEEPICPLHRVVCAAPEYLKERGAPQQPSDLAHHDCLVFLPAGRTWLFESANGLVSVALRPKLCANESGVLATAAILGNGIALLPLYAAAPALRAGTLVRVLHGFTVQTLWMKAFVPEDRVRIPRVRSLLAFIKNQYSPVPPWERGDLQSVMSAVEELPATNESAGQHTTASINENPSVSSIEETKSSSAASNKRRKSRNVLSRP
jgi:DNA-binding transcriptional LysR family regulator